MRVFDRHKLTKTLSASIIKFSTDFFLTRQTVRIEHASCIFRDSAHAFRRECFQLFP